MRALLVLLALSTATLGVAPSASSGYPETGYCPPLERLAGANLWTADQVAWPGAFMIEHDDLYVMHYGQSREIAAYVIISPIVYSETNGIPGLQRWDPVCQECFDWCDSWWW